ncbi:hypothetical protein MN608_07110 [Microdochium nivale]|nr:hypothetical protein MN608_07110 [Microdochium nivale]
MIETTESRLQHRSALRPTPATLFSMNNHQPVPIQAAAYHGHCLLSSVLLSPTQKTLAKSKSMSNGTRDSRLLPLNVRLSSSQKMLWDNGVRGPPASSAQFNIRGHARSISVRLLHCLCQHAQIPQQ